MATGAACGRRTEGDGRPRHTAAAIKALKNAAARRYKDVVRLRIDTEPRSLVDAAEFKSLLLGIK